MPPPDQRGPGPHPPVPVLMPAPTPPGEPARLAQFLEVMAAMAAGDTRARIEIAGDGSLLDGIATGLNMLADELAERTTRELDQQRRLLHLERLAAVGQVAAGLAHEINNPAAFVQANLQVLKQYARELSATCDAVPACAETDRIRQVLAEMQAITEENLDGIRRISRVTRSLLGFARTDEPGAGLVGLDAVAEEACGLVGREVTSRARLVKRLAPVPLLSADGSRLLQVAVALLVNAAHAVPQGDPGAHEVEISTGHGDGQVYLQVSDTGAAIPAELSGRAFEPFFTFPSRSSGTGLELFLAAEVLRGYGGSIRCWTAGGRGAVFQVQLPLRAGSPTARAAPPAWPAPRPRVLIVDDEPTLLTAYQRLLGGRFTVAVAGGGREAIELIDRDAGWDAIICDLVMPDLDGQAVYRHVEVRRPELARRMVFCTAGAFTPRLVAFAEEMRGRFLSKPLEPEQVARLVERLSAPAPAGRA